jgi:glycosyltransferase involved in cell wall biosynthesis
MTHPGHPKKNEGGLRTRGSVKNSWPHQPLVTVITVVLNGAKHLEETIRSVLEQGYENLEYLILDGGSTDGTLEIIHRYENQLDYWVSEPDAGIYDAMNKGLALARGELIALLNSDDFYEPEAIQKIITAFTSDPDAGIYSGHTRILQEDLGLDYISTAHEDHWKGMGFSHSAMFVSRKVYEQIGTYNCRFALAADYDFLLRALEARHRSKLVDAVISNYRNTGTSASNLPLVLNEMLIISRNYYSLWSSAHIKFLLLRYAKSMLLILAQKLVGPVCPELLQSAKRLYTKIFFARK